MLTTKQRAYLKGLAMKEDTILSLGKGGITPTFVTSVAEALKKRELVKIGVLKNLYEDPRELAETLSERTRSEVVQVIGRKIVLYKKNEENPRIELPKAAKKSE